MQDKNQKNKKLCVIPARGGSKRLPRKNIAPINGKPLVQYSVECAHDSGIFDRILVSSDDDEILKVVKVFHEDTVKRDAILAHDNTTLSEFLISLLTQLHEADEIYDFICLLIPTAPLRLPEDITNSWKILDEDRTLEGVLSVTEFEHTPQWAYCLKEKLAAPYWEEHINKPRNMLEPLYRHDGTVMWMTRMALLKYGNYNYPMAPYLVPPERNVDIDTERDLLLAKLLMESGGAQ